MKFQHELLESYSLLFEAKLSNNCLKHYDKLSSGYELISQIESRISKNVEGIEFTRKTIKNTKDYLFEKSIKIK